MSVLKELLAYLLGFERKTVASVTVRFHKIVAELEALEQRALEDVGFHVNAVKDHQQEIEKAQAEALQARKVADNIKALVS